MSDDPQFTEEMVKDDLTVSAREAGVDPTVIQLPIVTPILTRNLNKRLRDM